MLDKNFNNNSDGTITNDVRRKYGLLAGKFGIISNLFLGISKIIVGFISNSISITIDAINSITDSVSSILIIIGFSLVNKKPTKNHPYGYARYEYICGFVISLFMLLTGVLFVKESINKIFNKNTLVITNVTYIVLVIAIIIKYIQMKLYLNLSNKIDSSTLKTSAVDTRNDIISSFGILLSMIVMKIFNINIDGYVGLIVSLIVIYSSIKMIKEVLKPIVGLIPNEKLVNEIKSKLLSYEYVEGIHDLVIHNYGVNNDFITVHVEIDYKMDLLTSHDLIDSIERDFKKVGLNLTIHIDPVITGNQAFDEIKEKVITEIKRLDSKLTIHDFRIIEDFSHTNILFDCVIPYEKSFNKEEIVNHLRKNIIDEDQNYNYIIEIDRPFC